MKHFNLLVKALILLGVQFGVFYAVLLCARLDCATFARCGSETERTIASVAGFVGWTLLALCMVMPLVLSLVLSATKERVLRQVYFIYSSITMSSLVMIGLAWFLDYLGDPIVGTTGTNGKEALFSQILVLIFAYPLSWTIVCLAHMVRRRKKRKVQ